MKVCRTTVGKFLKDIFLVGYKAAKEKVPYLLCQLDRFALTHLVAAGTLDSTLVLVFSKWSRSDVIVFAISRCISRSRNFLNKVIMRELERKFDISNRATETAACLCHYHREQPGTLKTTQHTKKMEPDNPASIQIAGKPTVPKLSTQ